MNSIKNSPTSSKDNILALQKSFPTLLIEGLDSYPIVLEEKLTYFFRKRGKYFRGMLSMLVGSLFSRDCWQTDKKVLLWAKILEYIHHASLLHDDVMDESHLRRGVPCVHQKWDNSTSILLGDFLVLRAFKLLDDPLVSVLKDSVQQLIQDLIEGQLQEKSLEDNPSQDQYFSTIYKKTASFFSIACQGTAILFHREEDQAFLGKYGKYLGYAYQLLDDAEDYMAIPHTWDGGHDFFQRKITYPLLLSYGKEGFPWHLREKEDLVALHQELQPSLQETRILALQYYHRAKTLLQPFGFRATPLLAYQSLLEERLQPLDP